ncbi:MAG: CDP-alcohol phosphatidyltransferase family protein [bacterium]|nr:CDP-alcohol phosphatidyltransferase family protein [bacterium]
MNQKILTAANAVTAVRLVLIIFFVWLLLAGEVTAATIMFILAWLLDAADGWLGRRLNQTTDFGYYFDKAVDRLLMGGAVFFLLAENLVSPLALLLLTKDIALLPVITIHAWAREKIRSAGWPGKLVTVLQGAGVIWLMVGLGQQEIMVVLVAVVGGIVGAWHLRRVVYGSQ